MTDLITTISPITQKPILTRQGITPTSFDPILSASQNAFKTFRYTHPLPARQAIVRKVLDLLAENADKFGKEVTEQMGRPIAYTPKEVTTAVKRGEYLLKISDEALKDTPGEEEQGFRRWVRKEPVGTVLVVFAWNYPYLILMNSLIPAILAGNTVLLKPSPQTPIVAENFAALFTLAGLPPNVIQVLHSGTPSTIEALIQRPEIASVSFTGSVAAGKAIQAAAKDRIIPVALELGGNDPAYVRGDVDIAWAAAEIVDGAVFNSGQSCCAIERVYVHSSIYEQFLAEVVKVLEGYKLGDPFSPDTHLGPVVSTRSAENIRSVVEDAKAKGARVLTPDVFREGEGLGPAFVRPELLADCTQEMRVMREETFGPVIPVMRVEGDEEAVREMNRGELGLTASVWTRDVERGLELLEGVEAGTVFVNRCDYPSPDLAWTGWKDSGRGVTLSKFGFDAFTRLRSWHIKDYPKA